MRCCYVDLVTGELTSIFSFPATLDLSLIEVEGKNVITNIPDYVDLDYYYDLSMSEFKAKGVRPSLNHKWNKTQKNWEIDNSLAWENIRSIRNDLLAKSDWTDTVSAQYRMSSNELNAWVVYRQALRDITLQSDPLNIVWPITPV